MTGCGLTRIGQVAYPSRNQFEIRNKFSDYLEGCQEFRKDRDKYIDCYQTALENDPSMNFNFDSEVRRAYLYWECNQMPEGTTEQYNRFLACIDNADNILKKEF
ncbi:MAG: hypothetical protein WBA39_26410 [Rivularia sp. (in: cyanobacteria)]